MQIRIGSDSALDKYPARQHARRVARTLLANKGSNATSNDNEGLIYLPGTPTRYLEDSDQPQPFRQRRYFYYLSGVNERDCALTYDISTDHLTLWLPPISARQAVWVGRGSNIKEALQKYDIDEARYSDDLYEFINDYPKRIPIYVLHFNQLPPGDLSDRFLDLDLLQAAMMECRVIKDSHEIQLIEKANDISAEAHTEILRNIASFKNEAQVEARFVDVAIGEKAGLGYDTIAGSGGNAAVLHYVKNNEPFGDRQLMVLDAGAEWQCYASDVTRTLPLNGHMSAEAQAIYDTVQEMQNAALKIIKPGKKLLEAHLLCHLLVVKGLKKLGILHGASEQELFNQGLSTIFYPHGLGHHLGLEVHDVMPPDSGISSTIQATIAEMEECITPLNMEWRERLLTDPMLQRPCTLDSKGLRPGMVITVEPGIYFNQYALEQFVLPNPDFAQYIDDAVLRKYLPVGGVRIEDDIVITESGWKNLTSAPKGEAAWRIIRGEA